MVLIQSQDSDVSTNQIIDWLISMNISYQRINIEEGVMVGSLTIDEKGEVDFTVFSGSNAFSYRSLTAYWHRKGRLHLELDMKRYKFLNKQFNRNSSGEIFANLRWEKEALSQFVNEKLACIPRKIGNANRATLNKLSVLEAAAKVGLRISKTAIYTDKKQLEEFIADQKSVITKAILDNIYIQSPRECVVFYTEEIDDEQLKKIPDGFFYSLFQKKAQKSFELRIFYLKGLFYSMAIFSQKDSQTVTDYRKYNSGKPNRTVPYKLPHEIEDKLRKLMEQFSLDSGSIDMIVTPENDYIFLEINPVGQFGMVSRPCNYYLEKKVANYLATGFIN